jgi:Flp pilus assembly protein TadB
MELLSLACGHCGAPLEVPDGTRFVTCGYCSSKLEVHRSGGAIYTEVLEALQKRTEEIADDVEILKLQNELERIDREWQENRAGYMIGSKHGASKPSPIRGTIALLFGIGCIIYFIVTSGRNVSPVPIFVMFIFIFLGLLNIKKSRELTKLKNEYERRRVNVVQSLRNCENGRHEMG